MNTALTQPTTHNPQPPTDPTTEFQSILNEIKSQNIPATIRSLQSDTASLTQQFAETRRLLAARSAAPRARIPGLVSDECAHHLIAQFIAHFEKHGRLEAICSLPVQRDALAAFARNTLDITSRSALSTGEIPLPIQYAGEIRELISQFGVARANMTRYPIGMGTARPARMGTRPAFGAIAMSAPFPEKSPSITFASLESHKLGGLVTLPREIDEQSIVAMGHFLARYGATEFARVEDQFAFHADGTSTFDTIKGIVQTARDTSRILTLATGKTKPSDATLDDFRALRTKVNKAALSGRLSAYYLDTTWETRLPAFRTTAEPTVYQRLPNGSAILDGYPIVWTDILQPYGTAAAEDKPIAVFGALSYWWFGEHGSPRMDTSDQVFFANDQLAVKFIEEIDFDYCAADATAALITAAP